MITDGADDVLANSRVLGEVTNHRKSRSVERDTNEAKLPTTNKRPLQDFLANALECPVCLEHIRPPISQCENGHVLCCSCRSRLTNCMLCRVEFRTEIRCLQLEKMAETFEYACCYARNGCDVSMVITDLREHEGVCPCRPAIKCPLPNGCSWHGPAGSFLAHLSESHTRHSTVKPLGDPTSSGQVAFKFALERSCTPQSYWVSVYSAFNCTFFLLVRASSSELHARMFEIRDSTDRGTVRRADSSSFIYQLRLQLNDPQYGVQAFGYEGTCHGLPADSAVEAREGGRALFVKQSLLARCFDSP